MNTPEFNQIDPTETRLKQAVMKHAVDLDKAMDELARYMQSRDSKPADRDPFTIIHPDDSDDDDWRLL